MIKAQQLRHLAASYLAQRARRSRGFSPDQGSFDHLHKLGFCRIEGLFSKETLEQWKVQLLQQNKNVPGASIQPGGVRWHHAEESFPEIRSEFCGHQKIVDLVTAYQGHATLDKMSFQISEPSDALHEQLDNETLKKMGLGRGWHMDQWYYGLKALLYLEDVTDQNGPFTIIPGSHRWRIGAQGLCQFKMNMRIIPPRPFDSDKLYFSDAHAKRFQFEERAANLLGPAGTVFLADTRGIHRARPVKSGRRLALWAYFS